MVVVAILKRHNNKWVFSLDGRFKARGETDKDSNHDDDAGHSAEDLNIFYPSELKYDRSPPN